MTAHPPRQAVQPAALSVTDAARYLGISRSHMYRLCAEGGTGHAALRPAHIGGRRVFRVKDLDAYLEAQLVPLPRKNTA